MTFAGAVARTNTNKIVHLDASADHPKQNYPTTNGPISLLSQSVPNATWDQYQYQLFANNTNSGNHSNNSDSDDDLLGASRMVDWVVGQDSPTFSMDDHDPMGYSTSISSSFHEYNKFMAHRMATSPGAKLSMSGFGMASPKDTSNMAASFSNTPFLFQSTSSAYHQQFPKPSLVNSTTTSNGINKFDSDDLTFDINDIDLDPMSFGMPGGGAAAGTVGPFSSSMASGSKPQYQQKATLLPLHSQFLANVQATGGFADGVGVGGGGGSSGPSSSEQTPTSSFKALRRFSIAGGHANTASMGGGSGGGLHSSIPELHLPSNHMQKQHQHQQMSQSVNLNANSSTQHHQNHHNNNNSQGSYHQKHGASPSTNASVNQQSFMSSPNAGGAAASGTSPVLINSFVGSGNAMRPNGLIGTSVGSSANLLSASVDTGGDFLMGGPGGRGSGNLNSAAGNGFGSGGGGGGGGGVAASYQSLGLKPSNSRLDMPGGSSNVSEQSPGMLLPPGRVVGGMVLNNAGIAKSELAEDGCPILKLPRMPFLGVQGTMEIPHRVWKKGGTEKPDNRHFMIMSYNVLAPMYCTDSRYHKADSETLDWDHRKKMILDEIAFYSPDFICLQELPPHDFKEVFLPALQKIGYDGHFQQKKREHAADGCAIFFLEARFSLMAVQAFAYNDQVPQDPASDLYQRLAPFPNIALVCVFQNRQARSLRCRIVNTHLHWDPQFSDTKLLQAAILMEWLERAPHRDVPTAIAADLNSRAGEAVVDYLVRGKVAPGPLFQGKDFGRFTKALTVRNPLTGVTVLASTLAGQPGFEGLLKGGVVIQNPNVPVGGVVTPGAPQPPQLQTLLPLLRHGTKLASAYDRKDLPFTNKTPDFEGSIDHILYTSGTLSIRDVLGDFDQTYYPSEEKEGGDDSGEKSGDETEGGAGILGPSDSPELEVLMEENHPPLGDTEKRQAKLGDFLKPAANAAESVGSPNENVAAVVVGPGNEVIVPPTIVPGPRPYHHHQPPPPVGYLAKINSFPTPHIPSDHLPLCAWLKWKTVPVGTGPVSNGLNGILGANIGDRNRARGGRRNNVQQQNSQQQQQHGHGHHQQQQQQQQQQGIMSTSAPNRGMNGMSQVQMQLLMQHQQQQQQHHHHQQMMSSQQKSNNAQTQGGVSALSLGLMNASSNGVAPLPRGYGAPTAPGGQQQRT
ncbi:Glucose-repressible alcohol dehydrogenase transcriptional effector [Chytriomyces hyalinus]|nr:Glucose-repressible alcohol dehydrogenase transcriptional effector [Chytriomyces hyalinus]